MAKQINARIITKHDQEQNWNKASSFVPKLGEIVVYEPDDLSFSSTVPRIKVGDGIRIIKELPFITDTLVLKDGGKILTTNDFTDYLKEKVLAIPENPNYENTTYSAGKGIGLDSTAFYNKGIVDIDTSVIKNSFIFTKRLGPLENDVETKVITLNIDIDESFENNVTDKILTSLPNYISSGAQPGTISVSGTLVSVTGLGDLAYMNYDDVMSSNSVEEVSICPSGSELITSLTKLWVNSNNGLLYYNHPENGMSVIGTTGVKEIQPSETKGYLTITSFDSIYDIQVSSNLIFSSVATSGPNFKVTQNDEEQTVYIDGIENVYFPLVGGIVTGLTNFSNTTASTSTTTGAVTISGGLGVAGNIYTNKIYGALGNDYAEYRISETLLPGYCIHDTQNGIMLKTHERLLPCCKIVSDTFGFAIGKTEKAKTPIAISGRVLARPYEPRETYNIGDCVCSGPGGTISKMTREEIVNYPDRIVGIVSEIPTYEIWENGNIKVDGRIWIYVK